MRRSVVASIFALFLVATSTGSYVSVTAAPVPGSQGIDTSLPNTPSAATVAGRGQFSSLKVTLNQTKDLTNQAISISWTGGTPTRSGPGRFAANFLQIFQCWGDDDGKFPTNPGPPPEQCAQGAVGGNPNGPPAQIYADPITLSRVISSPTWANYDASVGVLGKDGYQWRQFRPVKGAVVDAQIDSGEGLLTGKYWQNPYYNEITTNEIAAARTGPDGTGSELFEVHTGLQSPGLGCGQRVQANPDGTTRVPKCWVVIVPRGAPADENAGTPWADPSVANQRGVVTSPVSEVAWANRIAIPIELIPLDSSCQLSDQERRIAGNELVLRAVASWQPALCGGTGGLPPFSFAPVSDATARGILSTAAPGAPGMVIVNRPLAANAVSAASPPVYAPVALSGLTIGFNVERNPKPSSPIEQQLLGGIRVAEMNLTPRLVAKLLTQSYRSQTAIASSDPGYAWVVKNPVDLGKDPDFLRFNPEFELLNTGNERTFGGLRVPTGTSDAALAVWEWIFADPEAKAWLDGVPDEWGMKVNPVYATTDSANSTGAAFGTPIPNSFPKADPYCYQGPNQGTAESPLIPSPLCGTDWMPYTRSLGEGARSTRAASDGARIVVNPFPTSASRIWTEAPPQYIGSRSMMTITDTASAALYGLQTARLSRAGDTGSTREFVSPTASSMTTTLGSMQPVGDTGVLVTQQASVPTGGYPLTLVSYAAVRPLSLDSVSREQYAAFLDYAAGGGQVAGYGLGQLPPGFVPLPSAQVQSAVAATESLRTMKAPEAPTTTDPTQATAPTATTGGAVASAGPTATSGGQPVRTIPTSRPSSAPVTETTVPDTVPATSVVEGTVVEDSTATTVADAAVPTTSAAPQLTPGADLPLSRWILLLLVLFAVVAAWWSLEITKRARRAANVDHTADVELERDPESNTLIDVSPDRGFQNSGVRR